MRVMALAIVLLVAGCAESPAPAPETSPAQDIELEATPTTGIIRGVVVDEAINPVDGANVQLVATGATTMTNEAGAFGFQDLEPGSYFLEVTHEDHVDTQHMVEVEAGQEDVRSIRIVMAKIPGRDPFIEAFTSAMRVTVSISIGDDPSNPWLYNLLNSRNIPNIQPSPNGTVLQSEFQWTGQTQLADWGRPTTEVWTTGDGYERVTTRGPSPQVHRLNATIGAYPVDHVEFDFWASASDVNPAGAMADQRIDIYTHVFHFFEPAKDWQFGRDGEHPVPPA